MTVDICSTSEPFISPRISFSYDLNNQSFEIATTNAHNTTTFDFHVSTNLVEQLTSADELFFEGVLLPTQIKKPETICTKPNIVVLENKDVDVKKKRLKELLRDNEEEQEKSTSKSFWRFTRTTSLNSESGRGPKKLFRSLSLKRLLHNNTTDSTLNSKGNEAIKVVEKPNSLKDVTMLPRCSSFNANSSSRRLVTKKKSDSGVKINPVLNIPAANNINLLGYGSLFCKGRPKNKTK
ncbi:hypothetical protein CTI12_AA390560 [Artemisia annua]|uniref:Uncharacterized protein n=1 Tax=Artemisia annua TaxID=35608 RepID=A0A2U1ME89_ARTAN|nr:hypothetical protein CTI12_AA390560 [Artemisia annua]